MTEATFPPPYSHAVRATIQRAQDLAIAEGIPVVSVTLLARALAELHPDIADAVLRDVQVAVQLGRTNELLSTLNTTIKEATVNMATIADLTAAAQQLADSEGALAAEVTTLAGSVDHLATVVADLRANGTLSTADQAALDSAVQSVTDSSAALAGETQNLAREQGVADTAANPPQG